MGRPNLSRSLTDGDYIRSSSSDSEHPVSHHRRTLSNRSRPGLKSRSPSPSELNLANMGRRFVSTKSSRSNLGRIGRIFWNSRSQHVSSTSLNTQNSPLNLRTPRIHGHANSGTPGIPSTPGATITFAANTGHAHASIGHGGGDGFGSSYGGGYGSVDDSEPPSPTDSDDAHNWIQERTFYDDFTTIDWTRDTIKDSARKKALQKLPGLRGNIIRWWDDMQGWILTTLIAFCFAVLAYLIDSAESFLTDLRHGFCSNNWFRRQSSCCPKGESFGDCKSWITWSEFFNGDKDAVTISPVPRSFSGPLVLDFIPYFGLTVLFALIAVLITLRTRSVNPLVLNHEELAGEGVRGGAGSATATATTGENDPLLSKPRSGRVMYTAYGSGVPEVRTILSGFVIRAYLGLFTLLHKSVALIFSVSSGMALGKEGPFVHLATSVGNIVCRFSRKYSENDMKRRQLLSAAASAGVSLAFGSPLGGILFSLEEVSYYFLPNQLFRMFFCAVTSALFLKLLNPYGTGKIVFFEVTYPKNDWRAWEIFIFVFIGISGGVLGALFCRFHIWWSKFKQRKFLSNHPVVDVMWVAVVTAFLTFPDDLLSKSPNEVLFRLASPCSEYEGTLCPVDLSTIPSVLARLSYALVVKSALTCITFGLTVPAGIYIPSMIVGALFGRSVGLCVQYIEHFQPSMTISRMVLPGFYAMVGAGAFMAGITRMTVTLAVILFELTGSLDHVIPFSIAILVSNWVANAIEPKSLYELIIEKQEFPFLDNRTVPVFDTLLKDLVTVVPKPEVLDVQSSVFVPLPKLRSALTRLQGRGQFDGFIPIVKGKILAGVMSAPELEYALDVIEQRCIELDYTGPVVCKLPVRDSDMDQYHNWYSGSRHQLDSDTEHLGPQSPPAPGAEPGDYFSQDPVYEAMVNREMARVSDLTPVIDRVPLTLDINSPLALVHMVFTKLGPRAICVTRDGKFVGILHKKKFIDFTNKRPV